VAAAGEGPRRGLGKRGGRGPHRGEGLHQGPGEVVQVGHRRGEALRQALLLWLLLLLGREESGQAAQGRGTLQALLLELLLEELLLLELLLLLLQCEHLLVLDGGHLLPGQLLTGARRRGRKRSCCSRSLSLGHLRDASGDIL